MRFVSGPPALRISVSMTGAIWSVPRGFGHVPASFRRRAHVISPPALQGRHIVLLEEGQLGGQIEQILAQVPDEQVLPPRHDAPPRERTTSWRTMLTVPSTSRARSSGSGPVLIHATSARFMVSRALWNSARAGSSGQKCGAGGPRVM